jgi:hypothetical protein
LWGSLASCVPIANRHARRLSIAAQDAILPHGIAPFLTVMPLEGSNINAADLAALHVEC